MGSSRRIVCPAGCGGDRSAQVSRDIRGWRCYCHRCGYSRGARVDRVPLRLLVLQDRKGNNKWYQPRPEFDPTRWPREMIVHYGKYGVAPPTLVQFGIGWDVGSNRVYIPNNLSWQLRALDKWRTPKYMSPLQARRGRLFFAHRDTDRIVLVEDHLSAMKLYLSGYSAIALLSSKITTEQFFFAFPDQPAHVDVWMDPDKAGVKASEVISKALRMYGLPSVRVITSSLGDPKDHTREQIKQLLT